MLKAASAIAFLLAGTAPAFAQQERPDIIAGGVGLAPEYDGAEDLRIVPFGILDLEVGGVRVEFRGLRGRVDLAADERFLVGPVLNVRLPRDDADGPVGQLAEIDTAIELGGVIGYRFGGNAVGEGAIDVELSIVRDVSDAHDGLLATATTSYAVLRREDVLLSLDAGLTWADKDYSRTYFGVTAPEALASGLAVYRPGSGLRDVSLGLSAGTWFGRRWGVIGRLGASYLIGDIADSPVVEEGRRWQPTAGIGLAYRF